MKLLFLISNYLTEDFLDRKDMLASTIKDITDNGHDYKIFDDESTIDINDIADPSNIIKHKHRGKQEYWKTWQDMFTLIKESEIYTGYVFIPNDITNFDFVRTISYLQDFNNRPFAFNLINDGRTKQWVNKPLIKINNNLSVVGFTDCGFFTNYETIKQLDFTINEIPIERFRRSNISSGVGEQLSNRMDLLNIPIYLPTNSLCKHGTHPSTMHPKERTDNPLVSKHITRNFKVVVGIATMNSRANSLKQVINCLNNQTVLPDKICIYNNDKNTFNATDNGKFKALEDCDDNTYFLSMDDDILYPKTYIEDMIKSINKYKCIITHHGRILLGAGRNYYRGHTVFRCLSLNLSERLIDIAGTGVTAFHTSYFKPTNIWLSEYKRMSDCVFSLEASKQGKEIMVVKHSKNYFKDICDDIENSCFNKELNNCENQNKIADEIYLLKNR
jgi:hypothetical protein